MQVNFLNEKVLSTTIDGTDGKNTAGIENLELGQVPVENQHLTN